MPDVLDQSSPDTGVTWLIGRHFHENDQPHPIESASPMSDVDLITRLLQYRSVDGGMIYYTFHPAVTNVEHSAHRAAAHLNAITQQVNLRDYAAPVRSLLEAIFSSGSIAALAALGIGTGAARAVAGTGAALAAAGTGVGAALGAAGAAQAVAVVAKAALEAPEQGTMRKRALPSDSAEMKRYLESVSQRIAAAGAEPEDEISPEAARMAVEALAGAADPSSVLPSVTSDGEGGCGLFWSVDRNTLQVEFGSDGSFYLRMKLADGSVTEEVEGEEGDGFPEQTLRRCLRKLSDALFASRFAGAVG